MPVVSKPRTYKQYKDVINKRLIPALGDYEMEDLSPIILQRYIVDLSQKGNTKTGKGLAPNSVNCIILVLHSSLSMAYVLGLSHPKFAITKRNEWMAEQADLILCYIERESGGAYKAVQYAKKLRKEVINLAEKNKED